MYRYGSILITVINDEKINRVAFISRAIKGDLDIENYLIEGSQV